MCQCFVTNNPHHIRMVYKFHKRRTADRMCIRCYDATFSVHNNLNNRFRINKVNLLSSLQKGRLDRLFPRSSSAVLCFYTVSVFYTWDRMYLINVHRKCKILRIKKRSLRCIIILTHSIYHKHHLHRDTAMLYTSNNPVSCKIPSGAFLPLLFSVWMSKFFCPHYATLSKSIKFIFLSPRLIVILSYEERLLLTELYR